MGMHQEKTRRKKGESMSMGRMLFSVMTTLGYTMGSAGSIPKTAYAIPAIIWFTRSSALSISFTMTATCF